MKKITLVTMLMLCIAGTAHAGKKTGTIPVDDNFGIATGNWDGNGDMYARWGIRETDGKVEVCGLISTKGSSKYTRLNREMLKSSRIVTEAGETVKRDLRFFKEVPNEGRVDGHVGDPAQCYLSDLPAERNQKFYLDHKAGSYRVSR
ncbi:hypothetical protein [Celeribacter litoreus]|uniref:hypothetical protein n=1 Tax=Celeribacter litoreus TaxID=2876714 RepID=UPI001CCBADAE|nr:hypothetical protein [Celeribacter litoreus]MCA0044120.1 hypothetical protein [Celeribacter litoreus]